MKGQRKIGNWSSWGGWPTPCFAFSHCTAQTDDTTAMSWPRREPPRRGRSEQCHSGGPEILPASLDRLPSTSSGQAGQVQAGATRTGHPVPGRSIPSAGSLRHAQGRPFGKRSGQALRQSASFASLRTSRTSGTSAAPLQNLQNLPASLNFVRDKFRPALQEQDTPSPGAASFGRLPSAKRFLRFAQDKQDKQDKRDKCCAPTTDLKAGRTAARFILVASRACLV